MSALPRVAGQTIAGRYVLDALLGSGAFGQVWAAHDARAFNRRVAVKFLLEQHLTNADVVGRFWREGQAMAALTHPNVVALLEFGEEGGIPYLVNEFVEGESLRETMDARRSTGNVLTRQDALAIFRQICAGVGAAHDKGIVHRDLKPENVMIRGAGASVLVKILDFGVARILDTGTGERGRTETGRIIGSLQYMSPEQVLGDSKNIEPRSDLFALGALLYEILTLRQAFDGTAFHEIVSAILQGHRPEVTAIRPDLSPAIDAVVEQALRSKPADRFAHASDLLAATEAALAQPAASNHASAPRSSSVQSPVSSRPDLGTLDAAASTQNARSDAARRTGSSSAMRWAFGAVVTAAVASGAFALRFGLTRTRTTAAAIAITDRATAHDASADDRPLDDPSFWVTVPAPATPFTLGWDDPQHLGHGFLRSANATFTGPAFRIHRHEVTWSAYDAWARGHDDRIVRAPSWVSPTPSAQANLPVVGISWQQARMYCQALGGDLPTEAQWEYAARGPDGRLAPWGNGPAPADLAAFLGPDASLRAVGTSTSDRTALGVEDMAGNAEEWTASRYRTDDGAEPGWTVTQRTIRGLPLRDPRPSVIPAAGVYRNAGCISDECAVEDRTALEAVGFRCVRAAAP